MSTDTETTEALVLMALEHEARQDVLDEMVHDLASEHAARRNNGNEDDSMDEANHEDAGELAASVNNEGVQGQIEWLLEHDVLPREIEESLREATPSPVPPAA